MPICGGLELLGLIEDYWQGLLEWMKDSMLVNGCINEDDLKLFHLVERSRDNGHLALPCLKSYLLERRQIHH